jgi:diguanylate cyclase (GGDEF)-like protein
LVGYYSTNLVSRNCSAVLPVGSDGQFFDLCVDGKLIALNIYSPVISNYNELIGYDLLAFDYSDVLSELTNGNNNIMIVSKSEGKSLISLSKVVSEEGDKVVFTRGNTHYWANTIGNEFYFISSTDNSILFAPFYDVSWYVVGTTMLFYVVIVLFLLFYVVRFARKELDALRIDKGLFDKAVTEAKLDHLTKIGNRRSGEQLLKELFETYKGNGREFTLFLLDIDHLKVINDTYGHKVGDDVLTSIVNSVTKDLVDKHHVFRWGGDEFLIVDEQNKMDDVESLGKRILSDVSKISIKVNGETINPTVSIGISIVSPDKSTYIEAVAQADKAMYQAKNRGANNYKFFSS